MVYGEYTEDWRSHDRVPLRTQVYPAEASANQKSFLKKTGESTHTPGFHFVGSPGISPSPKRPVYPPLPPHQTTPAILHPILKMFLFLDNFILKSINKGM